MADNSVALDELGTSLLTHTDTQTAPPLSASDAAAHAALERRKLAQKVPVPTSDVQVRERLRHYAEPVTLFGEREPDRRARLLNVLIERHGKNAVNMSHAPQPEPADDDEDDDEEFYTEGSDDLLAARRHIATYSLASAKARIHRQRREAHASPGDVAALRKSVLEPLKSYTSLGSQVAGERPISVVRFSPDASMLATGSWSGKAALWSMPNATPCGSLHGTHTPHTTHTQLMKTASQAWHGIHAQHSDRTARLSTWRQVPATASSSCGLSRQSGRSKLCTATKRVCAA